MSKLFCTKGQTITINLLFKYSWTILFASIYHILFQFLRWPLTFAAVTVMSLADSLSFTLPSAVFFPAHLSSPLLVSPALFNWISSTPFQIVKITVLLYALLLSLLNCRWCTLNLSLTYLENIPASLPANSGTGICKMEDSSMVHWQTTTSGDRRASVGRRQRQEHQLVELNVQNPDKLCERLTNFGEPILTTHFQISKMYK